MLESTISMIKVMHYDYSDVSYENLHGRRPELRRTLNEREYSSNLLKYSDLSCSEIATSLGYCSRSAFTYAFRQFTGTTPGKYRG